MEKIGIWFKVYWFLLGSFFYQNLVFFVIFNFWSFQGLFFVQDDIVLGLVLLGDVLSGFLVNRDELVLYYLYLIKDGQF